MKNITLILFFLFLNLLVSKTEFPKRLKFQGREMSRFLLFSTKKGRIAWNGIFNLVLHWMSKSIRCL